MKRLVISAIALVITSAHAIGIEQRLIAATSDEKVIIATATNSFRTTFIEVNQEIPNAEHLLRAGILEEEGTRFAIITPTTVHLIELSNDQITYTNTDWEGSQLTSQNSRFYANSLNILQGEGAYLKPHVTTHRTSGSSRTSYTLSTSTSRPSYPSSTSTSCSYSSTTYGSNMTCRTGGRITYSQTCSVSPVTFAVNCRSNSY